MAMVDVYNLRKEKVGEFELADVLFDTEVKEHLIHDVVLWQLARRRSGTAATKNRSAVAGGGSKPWRQKGTGRARSGTSRSPIWRGGGTIFGPQPRSYAYKLNKKMRRQALVSALTMKHRDGRLVVVDNLDFPEIRTKQVAAVLREFGMNSAIMVADDNRNLQLSARNLPRVLAIGSPGLNVYDLLKYDVLMVTTDSLTRIQGALQQ
ncbi:MAG: 50S ribosomal protein L4 [Deltaproteobacteria bacterium]|nr:50S ribosomal protein L4 [Candidatus Anaeroferrophillacea bacterium]